MRYSEKTKTLQLISTKRKDQNKVIGIGWGKENKNILNSSSFPINTFAEDMKMRIFSGRKLSESSIYRRTSFFSFKMFTPTPAGRSYKRSKYIDYTIDYIFLDYQAKCPVLFWASSGNQMTDDREGTVPGQPALS